MKEKKSKKGKNKTDDIEQTQETFVKSYLKSRCNITKACEVANISRQTFYRWCDEYDSFSQKIKDAEESLKDEIEKALYSKAIDEEHPQVLIWLSKTKLKDRGYIEKQEQEVKTTFEGNVDISKWLEKNRED